MGGLPVPTAVPPSASSRRPWSDCLEAIGAVVELRRPSAHLLPERERRRVHHVRAADLHDVPNASARLDRGAQARDRREDLPANARCNRRQCIAVGNASFEDWPHVHVIVRVHEAPLAPSPARISFARLAITSLTFMFVCVPLPVCQTRAETRHPTGPRSPRPPPPRWPRPFAVSSLPSSSWTARPPSPPERGRGRGRAAPAPPEIRKCSSVRWVCAPREAIGRHLDRAERVALGARATGGFVHASASPAMVA